jgi:hypothetical protein
MKMPRQKKKLDPKILHDLLPLTILAFIIGVGGVWAIQQYITDNFIVIMGYILVFWFIFQSRFQEIIHGPEYFKQKNREKAKRVEETRKKYGGKPN